MKVPEFGFERREEESKNKLDTKNNDYGKIFSIVFLVVFGIPLIYQLFVYVLIPMLLYTNINSKEDYMSVYAYRSEECSIFNRTCLYNYYIDGKKYNYDDKEMGLKLKRIKVLYEIDNPYNTLYSFHSTLYYLLMLIPFALIFYLVISIHNKILINNKEKR